MIVLFDFIIGLKLETCFLKQKVKMYRSYLKSLLRNGVFSYVCCHDPDWLVRTMFNVVAYGSQEKKAIALKRAFARNWIILFCAVEFPIVSKWQSAFNRSLTSVSLLLWLVHQKITTIHTFQDFCMHYNK